MVHWFTIFDHRHCPIEKRQGWANKTKHRSKRVMPPSLSPGFLCQNAAEKKDVYGISMGFCDDHWWSLMMIDDHWWFSHGEELGRTGTGMSPFFCSTFLFRPGSRNKGFTHTWDPPLRDVLIWMGLFCCIVERKLQPSGYLLATL